MDKQKTDDEAARPSGWRGSREGWLAAARAALLESGIDAVKIQPLASRLNLSRTSFYWFFKDRAAILDALLEDWEATNTRALIAACEAYADTIAEAVLNVIGVFLDETRFEPRFDFAVRGWAHRSDAVMARVTAADEARLEAELLVAGAPIHRQRYWRARRYRRSPLRCGHRLSASAAACVRSPHRLAYR